MKPEYLTKEIAAKRLDLSVRRVLELRAAGKIRSSRQIDPATQREQLVLLASDVNRLVTDAANVRMAREKLALPPTEPPPLRPWMTAAEAADYSGLPAGFLVRAIEAGELVALDVGVRPGGRYRIRRTDLDALSGRKLSTNLANKR
jgi:excisionase family DNA binding protein